MLQREVTGEIGVNMKRAYLPNLTVTLDDTVAYMRYPDAVTSLAWTVSRLIDSYKGNPLGSVYTVMLENHLLTFCQHPYDAQPIELLIDQLVGTSVDDDEGKVDIEWLFSLLCRRGQTRYWLTFERGGTRRLLQDFPPTSRSRSSAKSKPLIMGRCV